MSHIGQKCDRLTQFFSTCEENKTLAKEGRVKRSPFYVEGDKRGSLGKGIPQVGLFKESSKEGMIQIWVVG